MIRTTFIEEKSKCYVIVFKLFTRDCKDLEDFMITVGINQIYNKTSIKVMVESEAKKGKFMNQVAKNISFEFIKAMCNFKTFVK